MVNTSKPNRKQQMFEYPQAQTQAARNGTHSHLAQKTCSQKSKQINNNIITTTRQSVEVQKKGKSRRGKKTEAHNMKRKWRPFRNKISK